MKNIGNINNKQIYYFSIFDRTDWEFLLPLDAWTAVPIIDERNREIADKIANVCIDHNVSYVCTVGKECEWLHDWFDETIVGRKIDNNLPMIYKNGVLDVLMTTWHHDFAEGVDFAIFVAEVSNLVINKIIFIDTTNDSYFEILTNILKKINEGWVPEY
jgi:hypothetical protein